MPLQQAARAHANSPHGDGHAVLLELVQDLWHEVHARANRGLQGGTHLLSAARELPLPDEHVARQADERDAAQAVSGERAAKVDAKAPPVELQGCGARLGPRSRQRMHRGAR